MDPRDGVREHPAARGARGAWWAAARSRIFNLGDRFLATDNRCPHKGGPLCDGIVAGDSVVCPLHAWKVRLDTGTVERPASKDACVDDLPDTGRGRDRLAGAADRRWLDVAQKSRGARGDDQQARTAREAEPSFDGRRVLTLESRRSPELALLVMNYGGRRSLRLRSARCRSSRTVRRLPSPRTSLEQRFGMVVLMTGVGVRLLVKIVEPLCGRETFVRALSRDAHRRARAKARGGASRDRVGAVGHRAEPEHLARAAGHARCPRGRSAPPRRACGSAGVRAVESRPDPGSGCPRRRRGHGADLSVVDARRCRSAS